MAEGAQPELYGDKIEVVFAGRARNSSFHFWFAFLLKNLDIWESCWRNGICDSEKCFCPS